MRLERGAFALALFFVSYGRTLGQIDPDDTGEGTRLGLTQQNNSGQVGTVDLIALGKRGTLVILRVFSAPQYPSERARIARAGSCRDPRPRPAVELAPVIGGVSRSVIARGHRAIFGGATIVEVLRHGRRGFERVSCGELRR